MVTTAPLSKRPPREPPESRSAAATRSVASLAIRLSIFGSERPGGPSGGGGQLFAELVRGRVAVVDVGGGPVAGDHDGGRDREDRVALRQLLLRDGVHLSNRGREPPERRLLQRLAGRALLGR